MRCPLRGFDRRHVGPVGPGDLAVRILPPQQEGRGGGIGAKGLELGLDGALHVDVVTGRRAIDDLSQFKTDRFTDDMACGLKPPVSRFGRDVAFVVGWGDQPAGIVEVAGQKQPEPVDGRVGSVDMDEGVPPAKFASVTAPSRIRNRSTAASWSPLIALRLDRNKRAA